MSFEAAQLVFEDQLHVSRQDRVEAGEQRRQTLGSVDGIVLLLVAHTWCASHGGDEDIRIISARRATKMERKFYEQGA